MLFEDSICIYITPLKTARGVPDSLLYHPSNYIDYLSTGVICFLMINCNVRYWTVHNINRSIDAVTGNNLDEPGLDLLHMGSLQWSQTGVTPETSDNFRHRPLL